MLEAVEGVRYVPELLEAMCCVLGVVFCVLGVLEVLENVHYVLRCMLEARRTYSI